jgi:hypothetical protein
MSYSVETRWGGSERAPGASRMREILAELDKHDPEHPDTWLTHESGWTLAIFESGLVVWENVENPGEPRHQVGISRDKALNMWLKLSRGEIPAIEQEPWRSGYSPPRSPEEQAKLLRESQQMTLALFRQCYNQLGPERTEVHCARAGCNRGAIRFSVFCRPHHFENIYHQPCPFED